MVFLFFVFSCFALITVAADFIKDVFVLLCVDKFGEDPLEYEQTRPHFSSARPQKAGNNMHE